MKRMTKISTAVVAALASLSAPLAMAQSSEPGASGDYYWGLRLGLGWTDTDRIASFDGANNPQFFDGGADVFVPGIEAGYRFAENWETRIYFEDLQGDIGDSTQTAYGDSWGADILYSFTDKAYAGLGLNKTDLGIHKDTFLRGTLGWRHFMDEHVAFRTEVALQQNDENFTEALASVGLQFFFGGDQQAEPRPAPERRPTREPEPTPAAPVDSDNDGVVDADDKCPNTPETYSVDEEGCVIYRNETVTEELLVEFALNSSQVRDGYDDDIAEMADFMNEHPQLDIVIEGHTDHTGERDYNQWLSERRANAVGNRLIENYGIADERVETVGYGEDKPKVEGNSAEARQENRRIEAKLSVTNRVPVTEDN